MLCPTRLGRVSHSSRDTTDSSALTWKYSSTSTVKKCVVAGSADGVAGGADGIVETGEKEPEGGTTFAADHSHFKCQLPIFVDQQVTRSYVVQWQRDSLSQPPPHHISRV